MKSPLSYLGGKSLIATDIIKRIPEHTCYCEVFCGAAWIFFKKPSSPVEVINDINNDLINLYRVFQHHPEEFVRQFDHVFVSRAEFNQLRKIETQHLTDVQKAARWFYLLRLAFGGRISTLDYSYSTSKTPKLKLAQLSRTINAVHQRLEKVNIEQLHFADCIKRYDRAHTFFYLDPPYFGMEDNYGKDLFHRSDYARLAQILTGIKGKFILSINDSPEIRKIFQRFHIEEIQFRYQPSQVNGRRNATELLITNFPTKS